MSVVKVKTTPILDPFEFPDAPPGGWLHAMESEHSYTEGDNEYEFSDPLMDLELPKGDAPVALCALIATSGMEVEPVQNTEEMNKTPGMSKDKKPVCA